MSASFNNSDSRNKEESHKPRYLDYNGIRDRLVSLGFPMKPYQLRGWIRDRRLPTFKLAGKVYIDQNELDVFIRRLQTDALKESNSDRKASHMGNWRKPENHLGGNIL